MAYKVYVCSKTGHNALVTGEWPSLRDCILLCKTGAPMWPQGMWYEIFDTDTGRNALHSPTPPRVEMPEWPIGELRALEMGVFRVELKRVKSASKQAYEVRSQGRMLGLVFKTDTAGWAFTGAAAGIAPRLDYASSYAACRDLLARYPDHMLESAF